MKNGFKEKTSMCEVMYEPTAAAAPVLLIMLLLVMTPLLYLRPAQAISSVSSPTFNTAGMKTSMNSAYGWAVSRTLPNGTAILTGVSNNLLSTSLVGRVLTYVQTGIGNASSLALLQKMVNSEHLLLQNPRYITIGTWATADIPTQLKVHRDAQKFLLRAYGLTLNQAARSDFIIVTQDMYLNRPHKYEYFDTIAWGFADAIWHAYFGNSSLPPSTDFTTAVQDLGLKYNQSAALANSANAFVDYARLMHYLVPLEYTDSYFRLGGNSLDQTYLALEVQLANQLLTRQLPSGNISSLNPYKPYLVEDYARDLDAVYYLGKNPGYVSSAFKAESFLTGLYLKPNGNITIPKSGDGFNPIIAYHLILIANDIRPSSMTNWYSALSQASRIINFTLSIQKPDGTFNFYFNSTNPGFTYTTIASVATIVNSYIALRTTNFQTATTSATSGSQSTSSASQTGGTTITHGTQTSSNGNNGIPGSQNSPLSNLTSLIPSWAYIAIPLLLLIAVAVLYEARNRTRYRGLVDKK
jgi:hypothetical protein